MTGLAALLALVTFALVAGWVTLRRRRRDGIIQRPMVLASPGGKAFASHVGSLSDFRMDLQLPRRR